MNDDTTMMIGRRAAFRKGVALAGVALLPVLAASTDARAATSYGSASKTSVHYVAYTAHHQCEDCKFFIAGASSSQPGHCKVVAGPIQPHGSCMLWSALPPGTPDNG